MPSNSSQTLRRGEKPIGSSRESRSRLQRQKGTSMTARYNLSKGATNEPHGEDSLPRSTAFRPCPECGAESEWELDHRQCSVCAYRHGARPDAT